MSAGNNRWWESSRDDGEQDALDGKKARPPDFCFTEYRSDAELAHDMKEYRAGYESGQLRRMAENSERIAEAQEAMRQMAEERNSVAESPSSSSYGWSSPSCASDSGQVENKKDGDSETAAVSSADDVVGAVFLVIFVVLAVLVCRAKTDDVVQMGNPQGNPIYQRECMPRQYLFDFDRCQLSFGKLKCEHTCACSSPRTLVVDYQKCVTFSNGSDSVSGCQFFCQ